MNFWTHITPITTPAPLFELEFVKSHSRISYDDDDDYLEHLIDVATSFMRGPNGAGLALTTQQWRLSLDSLPHCGVEIPLTPLQSVDSIVYRDVEGVLQTLDANAVSNAVVYDTDASVALLKPAYGTFFPIVRTEPGSVKITFTSGYGAASDVPADLRQAGLLLIDHLHENRGGIVGLDKNVVPQELPYGIKQILDRYRVMPFG